MAKPGMFGQIKQAAQMQRRMKKMQKELARQTVEARSGDVMVVARGDMTIKSVHIDPEALKNTRQELLEKMIASAVNNALKATQKEAGAAMAKNGGLGGLADLLGQR